MTASVISLVERRAAVADPVLNRVETYWDDLRSGRNAPSRAEVSPQGLSNVLSNCFILERIAPGLARFRVFGRHVSDVMGADLRGMPISAMFFAEDREVLEETLTQVFDRPATARLAVESPGGFGRERLACKMALLPLRDDLGSMSRLLGAITVTGEVGKTPRRLAITGKTLLDVPMGEAMKGVHIAPSVPKPRPIAASEEMGKIVRLPLSAE
ncbi:MAG: PAS domain-containing protein [Pseudomonadota bacterium]